MRTGTTMEGAACAVNPASTGALCAQRTCSTFSKWAQALALPSVDRACDFTSRVQVANATIGKGNDKEGVGVNAHKNR